MASENVDKVLLKMRDDPALALELSLALVRLEASAGVNLTVPEKQELFQSLAEDLTKERVTLIWD